MKRAFRISPASFLALAAIAAGFSACSYRENKGPDLNSLAGVGGQGGVSFAQVRDQVLVPSCVSCHHHAASGFDDYQTVMSALDDIKEHVLVIKDMPKGAPLTGAQMTLLETWMNEGSPENAPSSGNDTAPTGVTANTGSGAPTGESSPTGETLTPTWGNLQTQFFEKHCTMCHSNGDTDPDFTDYATTKTNVDKIFDEVFVLRKMPPAHRHDPVSDDERELFEDWVYAGMPGPSGASGPTGASGASGDTGSTAPTGQ